MMIALSCGIPIGIATLVVGGILYFATTYKILSFVVVGIGAAITIITFILIILAASSQM